MHLYVTRNCHDPQISKLNADSAKNTDLESRNNTPIDIRESATLDGFKRQPKVPLMPYQGMFQDKVS